MKEFRYTIKMKMGMHARPAGMLADRAKCCGAEVTICCNGKKADAKKVMDVLNLKIEQGMEVQIIIEGGDEDQIAFTMEKLFQENY